MLRAGKVLELLILPIDPVLPGRDDTGVDFLLRLVLRIHLTNSYSSYQALT